MCFQSVCPRYVSTVCFHSLFLTYDVSTVFPMRIANVCSQSVLPQCVFHSALPHCVPTVRLPNVFPPIDYTKPRQHRDRTASKPRQNRILKPHTVSPTSLRRRLCLALRRMTNTLHWGTPPRRTTGCSSSFVLFSVSL